MSLYRIGYEGCLKNVDQYIKDVRTLIDKKSYGHALGMAILAKEELAKAVGYFFISLGVIDASDNAGKKFLKILHSAHKIKIGVAHLLLFVPEMISKIKDRVGEVVKKQVKYTRKREELIRRVSEDLLYSSIAPPVFKMVDERKRKWEEIQKLKLEGFYVGIDNAAVITPDKITEEETTAQLDELERNRKVVSEMPVWLNQMPPQGFLIIKEVMKEYWKLIAKELEK